MRFPAIVLLVAMQVLPATAAVFVSEPTAIRNGWSTFAVLTRGDAVPLLGGAVGESFTWTESQRMWDGLGATLADAGTIRVYINGETSPGSIARVHLDREAIRTWIASRVVGNGNTNQVASPPGVVKGIAHGWSSVAAGDGTLARPCSGNLWEANAYGYGRGFQDRLYLTSEETFGATPSGHFWAIDPATDTLYEAPDVGGAGSWESATLIDTGRTDTIALLLGEDRGADPGGTATLSLYVGRKDPAGSFLARNGLVGGTTYFWDADGTSSRVGTLQGTLFTGNGVAAAGTWTTDRTEAVRFSKAEDVHTNMQTTSAGFGTEAVLACQDQAVFRIDFSHVDFVAGDLGMDRRSEVSVLFAAGTDRGDGSGATGLFGGMDNLVWSPDGSVYVNEDDGEGDIWQIRVADLRAQYAAGDLTPNDDTVCQILDADAIAGLGISESSGIIDISGLVGYVPGSVFLTNGMGGVADQLAMLVAPTATLAPAVTTIDVGRGSQQGQRQAGFPILSGTTPVVKTGAGTLVVDQINTLTGSLTVRAGRLELTHPQALGLASLAPLAGGTAAVTGGLAIEVAGLAPLAGGLLDVGSGLVTVDAGLAAADLVAAIRAGRGGGSWAGPSGITSTAAAIVGETRSVGWRDDGGGSLTFGFATPGDTNLDRAVDLIDAANLIGGGRFDSGPGATWTEGDFDYDGLVDILDVAAFICTALYDAGSYAGVPQMPAPLVAVPEPAGQLLGIAAVGVTVCTLSGRRLGRRTRP